VVIAAFVFTWLLAVSLNSDNLLNISIVLGVTVLAFAVSAVLFLILRWLSCWRNFRRVLLVLTGLILLIVLFYMEEDVRGWLCWLKFKHAEEAKGEKFDFASVIPPSVPDDQNFALTPVIASSYEGRIDKNGKTLTPFKTNVVDRVSMSREDGAFSA